MRKDKLWIGLIVVLISLYQVGCSKAEGNKLADKVVNVEVETIGGYDGNQVIDYSGTIEESESIPLSFSVIGSVTKVYVQEGDFVKKGQLLAVINDETYRNSYEMSLASQKQAEDAYKRLLPMYKNGNLPEVKFVEIETALQQAKSSTLIAKKSVDDCKLYSTVDGIVGSRGIEPGMNVMPSLNSITIVKIGKVFAKIPVSENEIAQVKKGDNAKIKIAALNNEEFTGVVEEMGVLADPIAHTYKIKIAINNTGLKIKPGMLCSAYLNKMSKTEGLFLSSNSVLVDESGKKFVFTVEGDKAKRKYVTTGKLLKSGVEITSGLNKGEQVITSGVQKLVDNALVKIVNR